MIPRLLLLLAACSVAAWLAGCAAAPGKVRAAGAAQDPGSTSDSSGRPAMGASPDSYGRRGPAADRGPSAVSGTTTRGSAAAGQSPDKPGAAAGTARVDTSAGQPAQAKTSPGRAKSADSAADQAPPRGEPLVMENADRMEGFRSRGEYILSGRVRFIHGDLRLETERAVWLKDRSLVYAEAGMRITHRGAQLTSDRGSYDKNMGQAMAEGRVRMRDSSGEVEASGHNVTYLRYQHLATLSGNPEVRRYYRKAPDSAGTARAADSARTARAAGAAGKPPSAEITDTLTIRGRVLTYNDSSRVAIADGDVRITRKQVDITCRKAEYHDRADSLYLTGEPLVKMEESQVKGERMMVGMAGEEIRSLLVKGDAQAKSVEEATDTSSERHSDVRGDSLFMAFRDQAIDSVQVFRNAKGSYFDVDRPDYVNRMSGDYMVLRFVAKQVASANVTGGAKSTYFHLEKKRYKGRNEAEGDTIDFAFKDGKVDEVLVRGTAKGTYFGEPSRRKPGAPGDTSAAPTDTTGVPAGKPAAALTPPAAPAGAPAGTPAPAEGAGRRKEPERADQPFNPWRRR